MLAARELHAIGPAQSAAALKRTLEQNSAYFGLGLRPEEYCVMVVMAEYQQKLAKAA